MHVWDCAVCNLLLFVSRIKDGRTITGAPVVTLTVHRSRIMNLKEKLEEPSITDLTRIKNDFDSFGVGSVIPICRIGNVAARIADPRGNHTRVTTQQILHSPETAAGKNRPFG